MSTPASPTNRDWLTLAFLSLIWGTSYILIKWGLEVFEAEQVGALRLGISALAVSPIALRHLPKIPFRNLGVFLAVGLTGTALPSFLFPTAQEHLSSSVAGIFSSLAPVFTFLLAWLVFKAKATKWQGIGILIGFGGAIILATAGGGVADGEVVPLQFFYVSLIMLACLCYATSSNLVAHYLQETSSLVITSVSFFLVGAPALVYSLLFTDVVPRVVSHPAGWQALAYVSFLALLSTVLASYIFFLLVKRTGPVFSSTVSYLVPAVAVAWGILDGEWIGLPQVLAFILILIGVFLTKRK